MASLLELPDETLESVLLCNVDGRTLHQLTHVNKRLRRIASPILVQYWPYSHERLLLHLLHHPEFRKHVKELKFESLVAFRDHEEDHSGCEISDESLEALAAAVDDAWPALAKSTKWAEYVRKGNTDALCTLLLCWATKLSSIDITVPFFNAKQGRDLLVLQLASQAVRMWKKTGSTDLPLLQLRSVVFRHWDTEFSTDALYAAAFFHLPNVQSFAGCRIGGWDWVEDREGNYIDPIIGWVPTANPRDKYILDFPIGASPIKELILDEVDLSEESLFTIVSACQRLKLLVYRLAPVCDNSWLSCRELANVMLHHKKSLETLVIDFDLPQGSLVFSDDEETESNRSDDANDNGHGHGHDDPEVGAIHLQDCYQYLECLKSLSIDVSSLYKDDDDDYYIIPSRLPSSLVRLRLRGALSFITLWRRYIREIDNEITSLEILIQECHPDGKLPNLRQIDIPERLPKDLVLDAFDRLMELAKAQGVKIVFIDLWEVPWGEIDWY